MFFITLQEGVSLIISNMFGWSWFIVSKLVLFKILNCFTNVSISTTTYALINFIKGDTHMTSTLREGVCVCVCVFVCMYVCVCKRGGGKGWGLVRQKWDAIGCRGWGVAIVLDVQSLLFSLKKIEFPPWPDLILSQTLIYYWQRIFLLTLVSDSKAIL